MATETSDEHQTVLRVSYESPRVRAPVLEVTASCTTGLVVGVAVVHDYLEEMPDGQMPLLIRDPAPVALYHWERLGEALDHFPASLGEVRVRVRTDELNMQAFAELIRPRMMKTVEKGRLGLYYAEPEEGYGWDDDVVRDFWRFEWRRFE